jgi:hypothetical protein
MSLEMIQVYVRPGLDVPWFLDTVPKSHGEYLRKTYIDIGKLKVTKEESEDGMMLTVTFNFTDQDHLHEFIVDPYLSEVVFKKELYNEKNGIVQLS